MIRTVVWQALLFLTPFILYWGYITFTARKLEESGGKWEEAPFAWLVGSGLTLTIVGFLSLAYFGGEEAGSIYRPAQFKDGVLIPGEIISVPKN
jgi:hypothetical protein